MFYDGTVRVDNFSNKCLTNAELASLEFKLRKLVYLLVCIIRRPNTPVFINAHVFINAPVFINGPVFINELTSFFEEKAVFQKITYCR